MLHMFLSVSKTIDSISLCQDSTETVACYAAFSNWCDVIVNPVVLVADSLNVLVYLWIVQLEIRTMISYYPYTYVHVCVPA